MTRSGKVVILLTSAVLFLYPIGVGITASQILENILGTNFFDGFICVVCFILPPMLAAYIWNHPDVLFVHEIDQRRALLAKRLWRETSQLSMAELEHLRATMHFAFDDATDATRRDAKERRRQEYHRSARVEQVKQLIEEMKAHPENFTEEEKDELAMTARYYGIA